MKGTEIYLKLIRKEKLVFSLREMIKKVKFPTERGITSDRSRTKE